MSFHFVLDVRAFSRLLSRPHLSPSLCYLLWGNALFRRPIYCQPRPNSEWETWWLTTGSRALPGSQRAQPLPPGAPQARGSRARGLFLVHSSKSLSIFRVILGCGSCFPFLLIRLAYCSLCSCRRDSDGTEGSVLFWISSVIYSHAVSFSKT